MDDITQVTDAGNIIKSILKAGKQFRIYPANNPVYIKTLNDTCREFDKFFLSSDTLQFRFSQYDIYSGEESVYHDTDPKESLALRFFRDGFQELTFCKGLDEAELEAFLKIISKDPDEIDDDNDMATLFWEKDLQHIEYKIEDLFYTDADEFETRAISNLQQNVTDYSNLLSAYDDTDETTEEVIDIPLVSLTEEDLKYLLKEIEAIPENKLNKLLNIHMELLHETQKSEDFVDLTTFFTNCFRYALSHDNLAIVVKTQSSLKALAINSLSGEELKEKANKILKILGSNRIIGFLGNILDSGQTIDKNEMREFVELLDDEAVLSLIRVLGSLKSISARRYIIDALVYKGKDNISLLLQGLNDPKWYVVRNIIYILRQIKDVRALEHLTAMIKHEDIRVKKEAVKTIGILGGIKSSGILRECLDDPNIEMKRAALKAFRDIGSEGAKRTIMDYISDKHFIDRAFDEKKAFYSVLAKWKDEDVFNFLASTIDRSRVWKKSKNFENRACAAYSLGLLGNGDAIQLLEKHQTSNNKTLRDLSIEAIKSIKYVRQKKIRDQ